MPFGKKKDQLEIGITICFFNYNLYQNTQQLGIKRKIICKNPYAAYTNFKNKRPRLYYLLGNR